jgi:ATP-dependent Clp protease ATP-binding subunit ClpC
LRRTIQTELDNRIAELLLGGEAEPGDTIVADDRDGSVRCTVRKGASGVDIPGGGAEAERGSGKPADETQDE